SDNRLGKLGQHGQGEGHPGLALRHLDHAVADVLATEPHNILPTLSGVEEQLQRQAGARTKRMRSPEGFNLAFTPRFVTVALGQLRQLNITRRVGLEHANVKRVLHQPTNGLEPGLPSVRPLDALQDGDDVAPLKQVDRTISPQFAESLYDVPAIL